jgi:hypothetical protein
MSDDAALVSVDVRRGLLLRYDRVRSFAQIVQKQLKPSPGGDQYVWKGFMNQVEALRDALSDLEGYMCEKDLGIPDDTPGGEYEDEDEA